MLQFIFGMIVGSFVGIALTCVLAMARSEDQKQSPYKPRDCENQQETHPTGDCSFDE